jgi:hypothetical protein
VFRTILSENMDYFLNQLIFVMVKYGVFFEVWTDFLNIKMSFGLQTFITKSPAHN